jgi:hypothetical protein
MVALTAYVFPIHDFIALITAILVKRRDDLVEISEFFDRLNSVLTLGRIVVVVGAFEDEAKTLG